VRKDPLLKSLSEASTVDAYGHPELTSQHNIRIRPAKHVPLIHEFAAPVDGGRS